MKFNTHIFAYKCVCIYWKHSKVMNNTDTVVRHYNECEYDQKMAFRVDHFSNIVML